MAKWGDLNPGLSVTRPWLQPLHHTGCRAFCFVLSGSDKSVRTFINTIKKNCSFRGRVGEYYNNKHNWAPGPLPSVQDHGPFQPRSSAVSRRHLPPPPISKAGTAGTLARLRRGNQRVAAAAAAAAAFPMLERGWRKQNKRHILFPARPAKFF